MKKILIVFAIPLFLQSCVIIRPGEIGLKQRLGKLQEDVYSPGVHNFNGFTTRILRINTRTTNLTNRMENLPSKEGLTITAELAVLYHIKPEYAHRIIRTIGLNFEDDVLTSVMRSACADVTAKFYAKDMHTAQREEIEKEIAEKMTQILGDRGFVIENVLLKQISLPPGLSQSIENKLQAEQDVQRMEFVLNKERKEAERKVIEAEGIRNSQQIIAQGLSPIIIQYKSIEAFRDLAGSMNAKIIITDGKTPFLVNGADPVQK